MCPQTNYSLGPTPGAPGMIYDLSALAAGDIVSGIAATVIPFGVLCELIGGTGTTAGQVQPVQDTHAAWPPAGGTATNSLIGVSVNDPLGVEQAYVGPAIPPSTTGSTATGYPIGAMVPLLRRGRIWMAFDGLGAANAQGVRIGAANVWHSSTPGSVNQGVITFTATSTVAGSEVDATPASLEVFDPSGTLKGVYTTPFGLSYGIIPMSINLPGHT